MELAITSESLNAIIAAWAAPGPARTPGALPNPSIKWARPLEWKPWPERDGCHPAVVGFGISIGAFEIGRAIIHARPDLMYLVTEERGVPRAIHVGPRPAPFRSL